MAVDLGKSADDSAHDHAHDRAHEHSHDQERPVVRSSPPPAPYRPREPSPYPGQVPAGPGGPPPQVLRLFFMAWTVGWIAAFASGHLWWLGLIMLMMNGPIFGLVRSRGPEWRRRREEIRSRQRDRHRELRHRAEPPAPAPVEAPAPSSVSVAERALAATVVRVETSAGRFDDEAVALVREVDGLLRPLLSMLRTRTADPLVRHDLETLATEHLPRTVDDYLALPDDYAHEHRTATGTTPADELRNQLHLLVEGCRQLRDAVLSADLDRQQQQSRFLEAKFRRSDLDL